MKRWLRLLLLLAVLLLLAAGAYFLWVRSLVVSGVVLEGGYVRFERPTGVRAALARLESEGKLRRANLVWLYWRLVGGPPGGMLQGTYLLRAGGGERQLRADLERAVRQMVRMPEGWWIARAAPRLERSGVCEAADYVRLAKVPSAFRQFLPAGLRVASLEGLLWPDTYDFPPLLGARKVIERQLQTFSEKALPVLRKAPDPLSALIVASMVEAEVAAERERPIVAGVIYNRLRKGMPLQIDATVLYSLQQWKQLKPGEAATVNSPYNTYRRKGLPPGPIGSPGLASIRAAVNPARHAYLYYVALPNGTHLFSSTYAGHLANIRARRAAMRAPR